MKIFRLFTIAAAALILSACSEDIAQMINGGKKEFTATLAAPNKGGTRTAYNESGGDINVAWTEGDEIALIHNGVKDVATVKTVNADGSATINGTITGNVSDGNDVKLVYPAAYVGTVTGGDGYGYEPNPDIEKKLLEQDGTLAYIQDNIDFREDMNTLSVKESVVTLTESADMSSSMAIWKLTLQDDAATPAALAATKVTIKSGSDELASTAVLTTGKSTLYLAVPVVLEQTITIEATVDEDTYSFTKSAVTLNASAYYQSTVTMEKIVDLSTVTTATTIKNGYTVTGTLGANVKISIADGATVTLDNVSINADGTWNRDNWAGLTCEGDATIILKDGSENTVKGFSANYPGIYVPNDKNDPTKNKTLTIKGTGSLTASSNGMGAGIGGGMMIGCGNIEIQGGVITAIGGGGGAGIGGANSSSCGTITISGGTITANGSSSAAGIGSGSYDKCGDILISGGTVTATGGANAAGIGSGGGGTCGDILISGGTVLATGGTAAAGIGSGTGTEGCGAITISGGTVTATGGENAAGIGSGYEGTCTTITISGGSVTATGGENAAGIGSGYDGTCTTITISGGTVMATGGNGNGGAGIGTGDQGTCVDITITTGVTKVTATKGSGADNSIGKATNRGNGTCGTVTIGGVNTGAISTSPYTYPVPALNLTSPAVGQVIGDDGKNYDYASLPGGVTAVAKICYVSGSNGLALALADEGQMNWSTAISTCAAHTPAFTGGTWKLATRAEWNNMITAAGSYTALRDGFTSVDGTNMQSDNYWSSTEFGAGLAAYYFKFGSGDREDVESKDNGYYVRSALAF